MSDQPLYNSRIINTYVSFVSKHYPAVDIAEVLRHAEIEPYQVNDQGHWFTQRQVNRFHEKLAQLAGNPQIGREAGRFSASGPSLGLMRKHILGLIGPLNAFHAIKKATANFTRSASYESRTLAPNKVEITVTPHPGVEEQQFQCFNRMGFFEAILTSFDYDPPLIEHPECIFAGGTCCRYVISWKKPIYLKLRSLRNILAVSGAAILVAAALLGWWGQALTLCVSALLALSWLVTEMEKREIISAHTHLKKHSDDLLEDAKRNCNNALMVNEVGQAISRQLVIDQVLENITGTLEQRLDYDRCLLLLVNEEKTKLQFCTGFGHTEEQLHFLKNTSFNLTNPDSRGVFVNCFRDQKPVLVNDIAAIAPSLSDNSLAFAQKMGSHAFICCAIVCEGESLGVLAVDNLSGKRPLIQSDLSLITGIAPVIGISIRNAMYMERERHLAEQLRQSQKMEAVGQLAGGVAHDFNNLLTAIIGFTTLAQMQMEEGDKAHPYLQQILLASDRATHLTQGLLSFSRKHVSNLCPTELGHIVRNMEKLLRRLISEEIELRFQLCAERLPVVADMAQVDQVILNLATNARDAMERGGVLTIETRLVEVAEGTPHGMPPGRYAVLAVSDTGSGMDEQTMARVFEPFFTTKEAGKGTGLGLAIVAGNLKQHKGHIEVDSHPGRGTTFKVYFPLLDKEPAPQPTKRAKAAVRGNAQMVLVVEDALEVRKLTCEVLEKSGYQVIEAVDGMDALEKFRQRGDEVELVIMDVVMPKMGGKEAFAEITRTRPGMKVLYTSGYTHEDVQRKGIQFGKDFYLSKPAAPQLLLEKVREVLAA